MVDITAAEVFRDFVTDGVPSSGSHNPRKPDIRKLLKQYETIIAAFTASGGVIYASKAALDADLARPANTMAWVLGDAVAANNGIYRKVGASGAGNWVRAGDLPYSFILASNVGDGTPSAIQAATAIPVSGSALILLQIAEDYAGEAATVSFNGAAPLTIKTNSGEDVRNLAGGSVVYGVISGDTFRLANDEAIASLIYEARDQSVAAKDAAEAARDIAAGYASDAVSQGNVPIYATVVGMPALEIPVGINAIRVNGLNAAGDGLGGLFVDTNNGSAETFTTADGRTWYRAKDVSFSRLTADVFDNAQGALRRSGGTMTGTLKWDNGSDPIIPTVPAEGVFDVNISGTSHFKIFPDLDGDGDYDADIWAKDSMYIVAEAGIHLRMNFTQDLPEQGRIVLRAENEINYIQSARNFSGTTENSLAISRYNSSYAWSLYDVTLNGWNGLGFSVGQHPAARLHAKDAGATLGVFESTGSTISRIGFAGTGTASLSAVMVGAVNNDLVLRGQSADIVRINTTGMYPMSDNNRILGSASFRWSTVYAGTGTINTSDAKTKDWLGPMPDAVSRALRRVAEGIGHFQFKEAVEAKGEGARKHLGVTAQDVVAAFEAEGLDPWEWAPICKDPIVRTVTMTRKAKRPVTRQVEKTRAVVKKKMEVFSVATQIIEVREGQPVLVKAEKQETRPVVDLMPLVDEAGRGVFKELEDGRLEPVLVAVPQTYETQESYIEEVADEEEYDEEYEVQEDTGEFLLGLRADELLWGLIFVLNSPPQP